MPNARVGQEKRAPGRPSKYSDKTANTMLKYIEAGAYDYQAAEAVGIDQATFFRWMSRGANGEQPFMDFRAKVVQAKATARVKAEITVRATKPLSWLRYGPGRERPGRPGWTEAAHIESQEGAIDAIESGPVDRALLGSGKPEKITEGDFFIEEQFDD